MRKEGCQGGWPGLYRLGGLDLTRRTSPRPVSPDMTVTSPPQVPAQPGHPEDRHGPARLQGAGARGTGQAEHSV